MLLWIKPSAETCCGVYLLLGYDPCGTEPGPSHRLKLVVWGSTPWLPPDTQLHGLIVLGEQAQQEEEFHSFKSQDELLQWKRVT